MCSGSQGRGKPCWPCDSWRQIDTEPRETQDTGCLREICLNSVCLHFFVSQMGSIIAHSSKKEGSRKANAIMPSLPLVLKELPDIRLMYVSSPDGKYIFLFSFSRFRKLRLRQGPQPRVAYWNKVGLGVRGKSHHLHGVSETQFHQQTAAPLH